MLDLRTHIASLIAIFLALAVGIVVGIPLGSSERQMGAMQALQAQLRQTMAEDRQIREENSQLRARLASREEAIRRLAVPVVRNRLAGQRLALVIGGDGDGPPPGEHREPIAALRELLRAAGAEVVSVTRLPVPFGPAPEMARAALAATVPADGSAAGVEGAALEAIGVALATGDGSRRLRQIAAPLGLGLEGEYRLPARRVLLLLTGGASETTEPTAGPRPLGRDEVAVKLARAAAAANAAVVVGESESSPPIAALRGLADRGISTVDNVDSAAGQVALVLTLAGAPGNWGVKSGAGRLLPLLETPM